MPTGPANAKCLCCPRRLVGLLLTAIATSASHSVASAADDVADPEVAIQQAAESLSGSPPIPWYDPAADDFRPAEVEPPRQPTTTANTNANLSDLLLWLGWMLLAALLIYLVYLIARAFLNHEVRDSVVVERGPSGTDISRVEELPVALQKPVGDFLEEAQRLYRHGDYAQAIVYLFSHQLLQLDRRHWVRLVKGKTNRQYLREVGRATSPEADELATLFESTVLLFEEVFFGKRLPPHEEIERVWNNIDRFEVLVAPAEEQAA